MGDNSKPNPYKVSKIIAEIIGDREGVKIIVKTVKRKDEQLTA